MATLRYKSGNDWNNITLFNIDDIYPVGTVYMSYEQIMPPQMFGGSWARIENYFIRGTDNPVGSAGSSSFSLSTGGEDTVTLTTAQMPSHNHQQMSAQSSKEASGYGLTAATTFKNRPMVQSDNRTMNGYTYNTGGGEEHNNMPAYQDLYIWYRTA